MVHCLIAAVDNDGCCCCCWLCVCACMMRFWPCVQTLLVTAGHEEIQDLFLSLLLHGYQHCTRLAPRNISRQSSSQMARATELAESPGSTNQRERDRVFKRTKKKRSKQKLTEYTQTAKYIQPRFPAQRHADRFCKRIATSPTRSIFTRLYVELSLSHAKFYYSSISFYHLNCIFRPYFYTVRLRY